MKFQRRRNHKIDIGFLVFFCAGMLAPYFGFAETAQETKSAPSATIEKTVSSPNPAPVQPSETLDPEARKVLQQELKSLIEDRRKMVDGGAGSKEIQEITVKIQEKYHKLAPVRPMGFPQLSAELQKSFNEQFGTRKVKMDELIKKHKELVEKKASQAEIDSVTKQINDERETMQRFIQTTMQQSQKANPPQPIATNQPDQKQS